VQELRSSTKAEQKLFLFLGSCSELAEGHLLPAHGTGATPRQRGACSAFHAMAPDGPEGRSEGKKNYFDNSLGSG